MAVFVACRRCGDALGHTKECLVAQIFEASAKAYRSAATIARSFICDDDADEWSCERIAGVLDLKAISEEKRVKEIRDAE